MCHSPLHQHFAFNAVVVVIHLPIYIFVLSLQVYRLYVYITISHLARQFANKLYDIKQSFHMQSYV